MERNKLTLFFVRCSAQERMSVYVFSKFLEKNTLFSHHHAVAIAREFVGCVTEMAYSQSDSLPKVSRFELHEGQGISG